MKTKQQIIDILNETDDYKALGFTSVADDGKNSLITKPCGSGIMQLNRCETEDGAFYDDDVDGWNQQ